MAPRPTAYRVIHDVESLLARAQSDLENHGLHMPPSLAKLVRTWLTTAYQEGIEAQRQELFSWLHSSPAGRKLLGLEETP